MKDRWKRRKIEVIEKLGSICFDCKNSYPESVYEFHHLDPNLKTMDWKTMRTVSTKKLNEELDKCILLCANCHRIRHHNNYEFTFESKIKEQKSVDKKVRKTKIDWPSKEKLEKLVNEIPCSILAKQLGVSDKAISKMCKKLHIEKPGRGFWEKVYHKK
jgi:DNA-binding Lrp family transcriptional regulator